jgi:hypothetical protein
LIYLIAPDIILRMVEIKELGQFISLVHEPAPLTERSSGDIEKQVVAKVLNDIALGGVCSGNSEYLEDGLVVIGDDEKPIFCHARSMHNRTYFRLKIEDVFTDDDGLKRVILVVVGSSYSDNGFSCFRQKPVLHGELPEKLETDPKTKDGFISEVLNASINPQATAAKVTALSRK